MAIQSLNMHGQLLGVDDQKLIEEGMVYFTFWSDQDAIEATMVVNGSRPEYGDKSFILKVTKASGESLSGRIKLTLPPRNSSGSDQTLTIFTVIFDDAVWHAQQCLGFLRY